jgi:hypothetical protein
MKHEQFRIVYFATHGLLAGDVAEFAKLNAEPALVLSLLSGAVFGERYGA